MSEFEEEKINGRLLSPHDKTTDATKPQIEVESNAFDRVSIGTDGSASDPIQADDSSTAKNVEPSEEASPPASLPPKPHSVGSSMNADKDVDEAVSAGTETHNGQCSPMAPTRMPEFEAYVPNLMDQAFEESRKVVDLADMDMDAAIRKIRNWHDDDKAEAIIENQMPYTKNKELREMARILLHHGATTEYRKYIAEGLYEYDLAQSRKPTRPRKTQEKVGPSFMQIFGMKYIDAFPTNEPSGESNPTTPKSDDTLPKVSKSVGADGSEPTIASDGQEASKAHDKEAVSAPPAAAPKPPINE